MASLWLETTKMKEHPALEGDRRTEVLVIGGGMAGILCAYMLRQAGVPCLLVEADRLCSGMTGNTTAKITVQHGLCYDKLIRQLGMERAGMYLAANLAALEQYRALGAELDCDMTEQSAYVYSLDDRESVKQEVRAMERLKLHGTFEEKLPLPMKTVGAIRLEGQAQFHPLKFASALAEELDIHEHTQVAALEGTTAVTAKGRIHAKQVIVATHYPFLRWRGMYFMKQYQHRSYVIALEGGPDVQGMYVDAAEKGMSFRNHGDLLLVGGGDHRTGGKGGGWHELRDFAARHYPQAKERYHWAAQDCMTLDGAPYIGQYAPGMENVYVATGFGKWGMTASMVSALLLCDRVQGKKNPWESAFAPSRSMLHPQLAANVFHAAAGLLRPTAPRCTHMGCALRWNPQERSWDCSCHGSRFEKDGKVIDNPALKRLK